MADDVTLPPEMLPCVPADVIVVCPCGWKWNAVEHTDCPACDYQNRVLN